MGAGSLRLAVAGRHGAPLPEREPCYVRTTAHAVAWTGGRQLPSWRVASPGSTDAGCPSRSIARTGGHPSWRTTHLQAVTTSAGERRSGARHISYVLCVRVSFSRVFLTKLTVLMVMLHLSMVFYGGKRMVFYGCYRTNFPNYKLFFMEKIINSEIIGPTM